MAILDSAVANPYLEAFSAMLNVVQTIALAYLASDRYHGARGGRVGGS